jgi:hypothetical protein
MRSALSFTGNYSVSRAPSGNNQKDRSRAYKKPVKIEALRQARSGALLTHLSGCP